jgi:CRP-like cAMP-binding protein
MVLQTTTGKLGSDLWQALDDLASARVYTKDSIIFEQGGVAAGVHIVEAGEVRIFLPSAHSQSPELCGPGTILGLSETMSGNRYRVSAAANDHATVAFIPQHKFMDFLRGNCDCCMQIVRILSEDLHALYHQFRTVTAHPGRPRHQPDQRQIRMVDQTGEHLHR